MVDANFLSDITDANRCTVERCYDDALNLLDGRNTSEAVNELRLPTGTENSTAHILVVLLKRLEDVTQGEVEFQQRVGFDNDVVLLLVSPPGVDLRHARDLAELGLDNPVVKGAELFQAMGAVLGAKNVVEYLAEASRDGPQLRSLEA